MVHPINSDKLNSTIYEKGDSNMVTLKELEDYLINQCETTNFNGEKYAPYGWLETYLEKDKNGKETLTLTRYGEWDDVEYFLAKIDEDFIVNADGIGNYPLLDYAIYNLEEITGKEITKDEITVEQIAQDVFFLIKESSSEEYIRYKNDINYINCILNTNEDFYNQEYKICHDNSIVIGNGIVKEKHFFKEEN